MAEFVRLLSNAVFLNLATEALSRRFGGVIMDKHCGEVPPEVFRYMPAWDVRFDLRVDLQNVELLQLVYEAQALGRTAR